MSSLKPQYQHQPPGRGDAAPTMVLLWYYYGTTTQGGLSCLHQQRHPPRLHSICSGSLTTIGVRGDVRHAPCGSAVAHARDRVRSSEVEEQDPGRGRRVFGPSCVYEWQAIGTGGV